MCGICGIARQAEQGLSDIVERVKRMCDAQAHRGPDDAGLWAARDGRVCFGNRRLAIRDLSPAGHMPMTNADGSLWITYNGEIYNVDEIRPQLERLGYQFCSSSDTEVILHGYAAWGGEVVQHLRGMFAFAIAEVDSAGLARRLFLARDRLGIKPLYYSQQGGTFLFASELKALRASGLIGSEIDPAALTGYLMLGAVPNPLTIYQGVKALSPASTLCWEQGRITVQPYWQPPTEVDEAITPEEAVARVREMLLEAVRIRLVSDVPLGAFLSGGLDSSAIVALMRAASGGVIRTCSMTFAEAAYNEAPYARAVAEAAGAEHFERVIGSADVKREWDKLLTALDQPSVDGVNTYFVSQTAREAGLTVALSGLGGDELFGGYPNTFHDVPRVLQALRLAQSVPGGAALARIVLSVMPGKARWTRVKDALQVPASAASAYLTRRGLFAPGEVRELLQPELWQQGAAQFDAAAHVEACVNARVNGTAYHGSGFDWVSRAELRTYMHQQLLRDTDVMSMTHSLEVRVPLIDHRLVEMVLRLPETVRRQDGGTLKPLLRQAAGKDLPAVVTQRQNKQGFTFPFAVWLRGELRLQVRTALEQVQARGWLQAPAVQRVREDYEAGRVHWSRLWALVALDSVGR